MNTPDRDVGSRTTRLLELVQRMIPPNVLDEGEVAELVAGLNALAVQGSRSSERLERIEVLVDELSLRLGDATSTRLTDEAMRLTGPQHGARAEARSLAADLSGARTLMVTDPYFYSSNSRYHPTKEAYAKALTSLLPYELNTLEVFHWPDPDKEVRRLVEAFAKSNGITVRSYPTKEIHDRVWIVDGRKAFVVGTSFNTLGGRLAFVLDLPGEDLDVFREALKQIKKDIRPLAHL